MSKKDKKIKLLKKKLKELKAQVRKLESASVGRRRQKIAKPPKQLQKPQMRAPALVEIEKSPDIAETTKSASA